LEDEQEKPSTLNVDDAAEGRTMSRKSDAQLAVMEIQPGSGDTRGKLRVSTEKDFVNALPCFREDTFFDSSLLRNSLKLLVSPLYLLYRRFIFQRG